MNTSPLKSRLAGLALHLVLVGALWFAGRSLIRESKQEGHVSAAYTCRNAKVDTLADALGKEEARVFDWEAGNELERRWAKEGAAKVVLLRIALERAQKDGCGL